MGATLSERATEATLFAGRAVLAAAKAQRAVFNETMELEASNGMRVRPRCGKFLEDRGGCH